MVKIRMRISNLHLKSHQAQKKKRSRLKPLLNASTRSLRLKNKKGKKVSPLIFIEKSPISFKFLENINNVYSLGHAAEENGKVEFK